MVRIVYTHKPAVITYSNARTGKLIEAYCVVNNHNTVHIGDRSYFVSFDGTELVSHSSSRVAGHHPVITVLD